MLSLNALAESIGSETVRVRGESVRVVALSVAARERLYRIFPAPEPPKKKNPDAGSDAPKTADPFDAKYQEALAVWRIAQMAYLALVAASIQVDGEVYDPAWPDDKARAWLEAGAPRLLAVMSDAELGAIVSAEARAARWNGEPGSPERLALTVKLTPEELKSLQADAEKSTEGEALTLTAVLLDVCERYHIAPADFDDLSPGLSRLMIQRHLQRAKEERQKWGEVIDAAGKLVAGFLGK